MKPASFHPAVADWFDQKFAAPTRAQAEAWPAIQSGKHVLIAAPTGSGKTLAAFLAAIDALVRQGLAGDLKDETQIVYVSPLKALSNDVQKNLEEPLLGIREALKNRSLADVEIRTWVRTGDTTSADRERARKRPPHIVVTTPESLYILLGSESGRAMLSTTRTVIVDEIHALAPNKRGSHLSVSLERLTALVQHPLLRVGLSATQKPIEEVARFLVGADASGEAAAECTIIDTGHTRARDLALELTPAPLESVMSNEVWKLVYDRLADLIESHRTTLIFVNTRRLVERVSRQLAERIGEEHVAAHHGSLSKEKRFDAEQRLKHGKLKALVATASLELGIDIGNVDLVCQLGSPRAIATFLQRVGRSGHAVDGTPKGRLFPLSRDELVESTALLDSVNRGELDRLSIPERPLDVLAQQIVAEVAAREMAEDEMFALIRRAWPYRKLGRKDFDAVVTMLADGFTTRRGRRGALVHHDGVNGMLRPRRGARLTAITSGGAIPDNADYQVLLDPENVFIGTVNEDFAVESMAGDIFQLGNHSYRIIRVEKGAVRVDDAHGQAPTIPFWLGEAPGRSDELSQSVSRLRAGVVESFKQDPTGELAQTAIAGRIGLSDTASRELIDYLRTGYSALGTLPTQDTIVFERFFDEAGGMQLVIHSPYGSRLNRAWGLSLRKRFCRQFNFELQAAATEDNIVLSLTTAHSFDLADVARYLHPATVKPLLIQALLDAPMFITRWRWVAGTSLALPRFRGGKKVPAPLARMNAEDLLATVFPDQVACGENLVGEREIPDHPLVDQTIEDCLNEAMDIKGLERLLARIQSGDIRIVCCDLTEPSALALEVLSARPYAYLDDAPLEERRTQAVMSRRFLAPEAASDLGRLDPEAIARVRGEAWPDPRDPDELHDSLVLIGFLTEAEVAREPEWLTWIEELSRQKRTTRLKLRAQTSANLQSPSPARDVAPLHPSRPLPLRGRGEIETRIPSPPQGERARERGQMSQSDGGGEIGHLWIAAERLPEFRALFADAALDPEIEPPRSQRERIWAKEEALVEILRGRLEGLGPVQEAALGAALNLAPSEIAAALAALQTEGFALRGRFSDPTGAEEWCERRLLARIHHYTVKRLRAEIEPVSARDFMRFLFAWQRVGLTRMEGPDALPVILAQLEGFEAAARAWEGEILPVRLKDYESRRLDDLCLAGRATWARLRPLNARPNGSDSKPSPVGTTPITLLARRHAALWSSLSPKADGGALSPAAQAVASFIRQHGASFFEEIVVGTSLLRTKVEDALSELVALGQVASDSFAGLRALLVPAHERRPIAPRAPYRRRRGSSGMEDAGRWALAHRARENAVERDEAVEHVARTLLTRYGVVFWRLLEREAPWLPPWRDLLRVYRRLEARGEIRGGRFVAGFSGEQFALPEAIGKLRETRREAESLALMSLSGADPLNLVGIITPGPKLAALTANRVLYRDGMPLAIFAGQEVQFLQTLEGKEEWEARKALLRSAVLGPKRPHEPRPRRAAATHRLASSSQFPS
jgi:ATP-dependent Lhr-like helicase